MQMLLGVIRHEGLMHHVRHKWTVAYALGCWKQIERADEIGDPIISLNDFVTCLQCIRESQAMKIEESEDAI